MNEHGSMLPYLGALLLVAVIVLGLALDVALLAATYREAAFAADAGAEAGAARLEIGSAYRDAVRLDPESSVTIAEAAALKARPRTGRMATATADGRRVCVVVIDRFEPRLLGTIGVATERVTVQACATPQRG